jgi:hypothetical protein
MTIKQIIHAIGDTTPQNSGESVKIKLPIQSTNLGPLKEDEPTVWQFDEEHGLPVVSTGEFFGKMITAYDEPEYRKMRGRTTTVPKNYTKYADGGGHPEVNFTQDDNLGFFAPEWMIESEFPRLCIGNLNDYRRLAQGGTQVIWGEAYERPTFNPGKQKVREIYINRPDEESFSTTLPANEGWVPYDVLLNQFPDFARYARADSD